MELWCRSDVTLQRLEGLVLHGLLCAWTTAEERWLPGNEDAPSPPEGYIMSFAHFHEPILIMLLSKETIAIGAWVSCSPTSYTQELFP